MSEMSDTIRKLFREGDDRRDAGLTTPEGIRRFDDIVYGEDAERQILDVYRPKDKAGVLPVIVSVHGGGWVYGDKERYQYYCMDLACRGFAVVNFTYRLAPEYKSSVWGIPPGPTIWGFMPLSAQTRNMRQSIPFSRLRDLCRRLLH